MKVKCYLIYRYDEVPNSPLYLASILMRRCLPDPVEPVRSSIGMIGIDIEDMSSSENVQIDYYYHFLKISSH